MPLEFDDLNSPPAVPLDYFGRNKKLENQKQMRNW